MTQATRLDNEASGATGYGALQNTCARAAQISWFPFAVIVLAALAARFIAIAIPPLLDEQFFLSWAGHQSAGSLPAFLGWKGFAETDLWGPFTPLFYMIGQTVAGQIPAVVRIEALVLNSVTACMFFVILRRVCSSFWLPLASAILFCLFPLNAEAVSWLGGRGALLSGFFFAASLLTYQNARGISAVSNLSASQLRWPWLIASLCLFICSLLCSANIWTACLLFPLYEVHLWLSGRNEQDASKVSVRLIPPLLFVVATACIVAGTGSLFRLLGESAPSLSFGVLYKTLRAMIFPINEAIWHGYARQFRILYFLLLPFVITFAIALKQDRRLCGLVAVLAVWFAILFLPQLGHMAVGGDMFGSRLFYAASMPFCGLMAAVFLSPLIVFNARRLIGFILSLLGLLVLSGVYAAHGWNQDAAYRNGGRLLHNVQKSIAIVHEKTHLPFFLVRDVPPYVAVAPAFSTDGLVVFDGETGLLSARHVAAGALKEALLAGKYTDRTFTWDTNMRALLPLDLSFMPTAFPEKMTAAQIIPRFLPSLEYYKQVKFDSANDEIVLESNSTSGPAIRLTVDGLGPLSGDFIYVDATIDAPATEKRPLVEMYWLTPYHQNYDERLRRSYATAIVNDGKVHRYYLSLRSIGFTTSGAINNITLGFPAGAKVILKGMGLLPKADLMPTFAVDQKQMQPARSGYNPPFMNYINEPDLGSYVLADEADSVPVIFGISNIPHAAGVSIEVSMPDADFANPNGTEYSGVGFKSIPVTNSDGHYSIAVTDLPRPGVYAIRAVAIDAGHNPISAFSDTIYVLVKTHRRLASGDIG